MYFTFASQSEFLVCEFCARVSRVDGFWFLVFQRCERSRKLALGVGWLPRSHTHGELTGDAKLSRPLASSFRMEISCSCHSPDDSACVYSRERVSALVFGSLSLWPSRLSGSFSYSRMSLKISVNSVL